MIFNQVTKGVEERGTHGYIRPDGFYDLSNIDVSTIPIPQSNYIDVIITQFYKDDIVSSNQLLGVSTNQSQGGDFYLISVDDNGACHVEKQLTVPYNTQVFASDVADQLYDGANCLCCKSQGRGRDLVSAANAQFIDVYRRTETILDPNSANASDFQFPFSYNTKNLILEDITVASTHPYCLFGNEYCAVESIMLKNITTQDSSNWDMVFYNMRALYDITFEDCSFGSVTNVNRTFSMCSNLHSLDLSEIDFSGITAQNNFLKNNYSLVDFSGVNVACNLDLSTLYCLSHQSAVNVINALETVESTKTLTLYSEVKNLLTAEEIAVATAKGWTVA